MRNIKLLVGVFTLLLACFWGTSAFAQSSQSGIDLRAGLAIPYFVSAGVAGKEDAIDLHSFEGAGIGLNLQATYRWEYIGIGIEQLISGVFSTVDHFGSAAATPDGEVVGAIGRKGDGLFYGATYFLVKEYVPINSEALITFGEGIGAAYGAKVKGKNLFVTSTDAAFALKVDAGFTYFLMQKYGLGVNLEFSGQVAVQEGMSFGYSVTPTIFFEIIL